METFLTKAMNKLEPTRDKENTIVSEKTQETTKPKKEETTVIPTNRNKIMYKQMTLNGIANKGVQENG